VNALYEQFVIEARELIHQATDDLIAMERDGFAPERIDRAFRAFHTLKGSAGVVALPAMTLALHAVEDLLAAIHVGRLPASAAAVDQALDCLDKVSAWVDDFEASASLPSNAGDDARRISERVRALLSTPASKGTVPAVGGAAETAGALPEWAQTLVRAEGAAIAGDRIPHRPCALCYEPNAGCFFDGDDPIQLMRQIPDLLAVRIEARAPWPPLADFDPFACNLRLLAICGADGAAISKIFHLVPDQVRIVEIPSNAWPRVPAVEVADGDVSALVRAVIAEQRRVLEIASAPEDFVGRVGAAARVAANALRRGERADLASGVERAEATALAQGSTAPLVSALAAILEGTDVATTAVDVPAVRPAPAPADESERRASRSLRVDEAKINTLVNLAGDLIVWKNGLAHLAKRADDVGADTDFANALRREHDAVERLAGKLHAAILQLRLVPVAQVFRSFPRLVRDMALRLDKKVELVTRGEATESDKTIVDRLFEPLLHMVRNALDHGIESSEQRRAAGKPETAVITIQAIRTGDRFVLEVIDDGRGINPAMVRRHARERDLMPLDELAALSDEEVLDLIFSAGFSTAAEVSDISGRGIGMDVVRATAAQMGGHVSVSSRVGRGTTVRLDLPLNIALSRIMVVEAGQQVFGIALDAVMETVRLTPDRISQIKSNSGFVLRNRIVPICSLAEAMNLPALPTTIPDTRLLIVTEVDGRIVALEVDAIRERLEVVLKPMQGLLSNARGYSGTTLLGNGEVLLVLDLREILP
jgi:two-component system, chemotaxis family, sensor kinase CheA